MKTKLKTILRLSSGAFIFLPVIIAAIVGLVAISNAQLNSARESLSVLSSTKTAALRSKLDLYKADLIAVSDLEPMRLTTRGLYAETAESIDSLMQNTLAADRYLLDIIITDANGVITKDCHGRELGSLFSGYISDMSSLGKNDVYVSDFIIDHADYNGESVFYITKAILFNESTSGFVTYVISTSAMTDAITGGRLQSSGSVVIGDSNGNLLVEGEDGVTRFDAIDRNDIKQHIGDVKSTVRSTSTKIIPVDLDNHIGVYNTVRDTDWVWFSYAPKTIVRDSYTGYYMVALVSALVLSAVFFVLMMIISHTLISPMNEMISKMGMLNSGDLTARFDIKGNNEFSHMAETFNDLIGEVVISEELHRTIAEISSNVLFEWDFQKEAMYVSENFLELFDIEYTSATLLNGRFIDSIMDKEDAEKYKSDIRKLFRTKESTVSEYKINTKQGVSVWFSVRAQCVCDRLGELLRVVGVITNIDNEKQLTLRLAERASYDFLSQLYNRNTFLRELQVELERDAKRQIAVAFTDVDDFKLINDRYGHSVGDEIIKYVSSVIKKEVGNNGFAGRFGGDEFVMCVTDPSTVENIEKLAGRLIDIYNEGYYSEASDVMIKIKISIGIAKFPAHGRDTETLIAAADEAMYFVKKNGKSNYHMFNPKDSNLSDMMQNV